MKIHSLATAFQKSLGLIKRRWIRGAALLLTTAVFGAARGDLIVDEAFDYPDGALTTGSAGLWTTVSGTANQLQVASGAATVTFGNTEDVAVSLGGSFSSGALYYSALITMTTIPGTNEFGSYMMHFSDTDSGTSTDFWARLYVKALDSESFVYGIRNRSLQATPSDYPTVFADEQPVDLNTQVAILVKFDFATLQSTLWINPIDANSPSVTDTFAATFAGTDQTLSRFSIREASGVGTSKVEAIKVGTTFEDVLFVAVPEPSTSSIMALTAVMGLLLVFVKRAFC